jgi:hypothetical protein
VRRLVALIANGSLVTSLLEKLLDLPRELRLGTTWLVLTTLVVGADAYAIARFDVALLPALSKAGALVGSMPDLGWMLTEGFCALAALVLLWFYVMPMTAFAWRQFIWFCRLYGPAWMLGDERFPRAAAGWQWIRLVRIRAIEQDNAVLMSACDRRVAQGQARELTLRCVLATIVLSFIAFAVSTPSTGASLAGAMFSWIGNMPNGLFVVAMTLGLPGLALVWAILMNRDADFDDYIQLTAPDDANGAKRPRSS